MNGLDIGLSALRAQQQRLATLGQNLANEATPGYHRRRVELSTRVGAASVINPVGSGVDVSSITRIRNEAIETALTDNTSLLAGVEAHLEIARQVESLMTPGEGSVHTALSDFFNRLESLANAPEETTHALAFLSSADSLLEEFRTISRGIEQLRADALREIQQGVDFVNQGITELAELNKQIRQQEATGGQPLSLLDRRDQLVSEISRWVDVRAVPLASGQESYLLAGGGLLVSTQPVHLSVQLGTDGKVTLLREPGGKQVQPSSGRLQALAENINDLLPQFHDELEILARTIVAQVDAVHAGGLPSTGPQEVLRGVRGVSDPDITLAQAELFNSSRPGEWRLTVTDPVSAIRETIVVTIDPAVDTLNDLAARLNAFSEVDAFVDPAQGTLTVAGSGGRLIDFSGRLPSAPDKTGFTGTSPVSLSGQYSGLNNDQWTAVVNSSGTIGVTPGLSVTIRDQFGADVATVEVGAPYEPGQPIDVAEGVALVFGQGTVIAGETLTWLVTSVSDETGLLTGLGIGSLFQGTSLTDWQVRPEIARSPQQLAISETGTPGDARRGTTMAQLRDLRFSDLQGRTFVETLADQTAGIGLSISGRQTEYEQLQSYSLRLQDDRDATSGVDANEELLEMLEVERAFQAAARFVTTIDEVLEDVLNLVR